MQFKMFQQFKRIAIYNARDKLINSKKKHNSMLLAGALVIFKIIKNELIHS